MNIFKYSRKEKKRKKEKKVVRKEKKEKKKEEKERRKKKRKKRKKEKKVFKNTFFWSNKFVLTFESENTLCGLLRKVQGVIVFPPGGGGHSMEGWVEM